MRDLWSILFEEREEKAMVTAIFKCLKTVSFLSFADEESIGHQFGINKNGPLLNQREGPRLLFELHFLIMSFHAFEISRGLRAHPIFPCAIFICRDFLNHASTSILGNSAHLENRRRGNIQEIDEETFVKVEANFRKRLQICDRENDHHLSGIIFRF